MSFSQNERTRFFVSEVNKLLDTGKVARRKDIAATLEWNENALSQVMGGYRNVPTEVYNKFTESYKVAPPIKAEPVDNNTELITILKDQVQLLKKTLSDKEQRIEELTAQAASSKKLEAYLQSLLSLANTQLDVLLEHRAVMEKADRKKLKKAADNVYDEYQRHLSDTHS